MGTRPCEAESSGGGSRSSCPQIPRYFRALGRSCGALSAVCVSQGEVDWSFHGSGLAANQTAATSAHRLQNLIRRYGAGRVLQARHVRKLFQSLDGWEERGVRWKVWRWCKLPLKCSEGADPPRFSPEPTCHVFGSNLVANCA